MQSNSPFGMGPMQLAVIAIIGGALLAPFGIPPLPPDDAVLRAAPEECLLFVSSAGIGKPDPKSENHTDQLLANSEMKQFLSDMGTQLASVVKQLGEKDPNFKPLVELGQPAIEVLLSRPLAAYLQVEPPTGPAWPKVDAGFIVNCGDRKDEIAKALEAAEKTAPAGEIKDVTIAGVKLHTANITPDPPAPGAPPADLVPVVWGFKDSYFLASVGPDAAAGLIKRISGSGPPARWLTALEKQAGIKRVSTIQYLDAARLLGLVVPLIPDPKAPAIIEATGLSDLVSLSAVSGFGTKGMVSRSFANFQSSPKGLFELLKGPPLTADDLKPIPGSALAAGGLRLNVLDVYRKVLEIADQVDHEGAEKFKKQANAAAQGVGLRLEEDILASLGDVWTLHVMPGSGLNPTSGTILTVSLKSKDALTKIQQMLVQLAGAPGIQLPFSISEIKIGDLTAYHLLPKQTGAPSAAWVITADRLVVGNTVEALKAQVLHEKDSPRLVEAASVISRLKTEPVFLTFQDTKTLLQQALGMVSSFGPLATGMLAPQGITIEIPDVPDLEQLAPHVLPRTSTLRVSKQMIVSEAFDTVPLVGNTLSTAPTAGVAVALLLPAVQAARGAARQNIAMNKMKQIGIARQNYHNTYNRFPAAAIYSKDGKPLLSWRVAVLPYLDEAPLFNEFHKDEPWDSEHNKPLAEKMPDAFVDPQVGDLQGKTVFVVPTGPDTVFPNDKGINMKEITDGTSKTIALVKVDPQHAVPWSKPDDLVVDKSNPAAGLAVDNMGQITVALCDASVHMLPVTIDAGTLWAMFTRAGREAVQLPQQ